MERYRTTKNAVDGKYEYLHYPWTAKSFIYPTSIDKIVKQWHRIDAVWNVMVARESCGTKIIHESPCYEMKSCLSRL